MLAAYVVVSEALGEGAGQMKAVFRAGGEGYGFNEASSFRGAEGTEREGEQRSSWRAEQGAPSSPGVTLPV